MSAYIRYRRDIPEGKKFSTIRYPWTHNVARERAELLKESMPNPDRWEVVEVE